MAEKGEKGGEKGCLSPFRTLSPPEGDGVAVAAPETVEENGIVSEGEVDLEGWVF
jgi:hypothetical protein